MDKEQLIADYYELVTRIKQADELAAKLAIHLGLAQDPEPVKKRKPRGKVIISDEYRAKMMPAIMNGMLKKINKNKK